MTERVKIPRRRKVASGRRVNIGVPLSSEAYDALMERTEAEFTTPAAWTADLIGRELGVDA